VPRSCSSKCRISRPAPCCAAAIIEGLGSLSPDAEESALTTADQIPEPSADGPRDPDLKTLSVEQADALRRLSELAFAAHGVPVQSDGRDLLRDGPRVYGLMNLARMVAREPWSQWPALLDSHAAAMVAVDSPEPKEPVVQRDQWLLKLRALVDLPEQPDFDVVSGLPGLAALPAIDYPDRVAELLSRATVLDYADPDEFRTQALANLRSLPAPDVQPVLVDEDEPDGTVFALVSDDYYGAARALVLEDVIEALPDVGTSPHGYLVGVPHRHLLLVHPVTGPGVYAAIQAMVNIVGNTHDESPGPITKDLYFIPTDAFELGLYPHDEIAQRITLYQEDKVMILVPGHLEHALGQLGLLESAEE
jgi:hypothetical protein